MSESSRSLFRSVIWPFTSFATVIKVVDGVGRSGPEGISKERLGELLKLSRSSINNALPITESLGFLEVSGYRKSTLRLLPEGRMLQSALAKGDIQGLRQLGQLSIAKSPVLERAYAALFQDPDMSSEELARRVAEELGKKWATATSYRGVGRSVVNILTGLQLIPAGRTRRVVRWRSTMPNLNALVPSATADGLFRYAVQLDSHDMRAIAQPEDAPRKKWSIMDQFRSLIDLGLAVPDGEMRFRLSPIGARIKTAIREGNQEEFGRLFSSVLLAHPVCRAVINHLIDRGSSVGWREIGEEVRKINGRDWRENTTRIAGLRFLSWLKVSGIAKPNHESGKFGISLPQVEPLRMENLHSEENLELVHEDGISGPGESIEVERGKGAVRAFIVDINRVLVSEDNEWNQNEESRRRLLEEVAFIGRLHSRPLPYLVPVIRHQVEKAFARREIGDLRDAALLAHQLDMALTEGNRTESKHEPERKHKAEVA